MSTTTEDSSSYSTESNVHRLKDSFSAMRLSFVWLGTRKSLSNDQRSAAAAQFGAERKFISAGKKLIDTSHPAMKGVARIKRQIVEYWKGNSLPYPELGIRLVRQVDLEALNERMNELQEDLGDAVRVLKSSYDELKEQARDRLGALFSASDYPPTRVGQFEVSWDFPNVQPPDYLRRLQPEIYSQECDRIRDRFSEAARLAEQAFVQELSDLVSHLGERLAGTDDGKPKIFRDSAIENLTAFFDRFQRLNIASSRELDELVERARSVIFGVQPQALRVDSGLRQQVASQLSSVQSVLDGLMVDRPRRRILRGRD